ncbi:MAG: hypothetical protein ACRDJP_04420, partial [Actinomycetota bacterium]
MRGLVLDLRAPRPAGGSRLEAVAPRSDATQGARPRPGSRRLRRLLCALAAVATLGACALPGADEPASDSPLGASTGLPRGLGERSAPLEADDVPVAPEPKSKNGNSTDGEDDTSGDEGDGASGGAGKGKKNGGGKGGGGGGDGDVFPPPPPGGQGTSSVRLVRVSEPAGDAGRDA